MTAFIATKIDLCFARVALLVLLYFISAPSVMAKALIFATPPTQNAETTLKNYQPLVEYLSKTIGQTIVIDPAHNYQEYTSKMRKGMYDMVLDGAHFIKWRIEKQHHVVIAKQPGDLHFVVVVKKNSKYKDEKDLWTKPICSLPVPHIAPLTLLAHYNNPIREPVIVPVESFKSGLACLQKGEGVAVLLRDKFWQKAVKDKSNLRVLYVTKRKLPARGLTVGPRVSLIAQKKITDALISAKGREYTEKAFSTVGGGKFIHANTKEFDSLEEVIQLVWGFNL
jgi:phosphonate transport system substrate-binding protein